MNAVADVVVLGAGAAGMMCAARLGRSGLRVLLLDHAKKLGEKIRISGGGRCNFTNRDVSAANFISRNPHFCKAALSGYTPADLLQEIDRHGIAWHEKHRGQLFCDDSSQEIIDWLVHACAEGKVQRYMDCTVHEVRQLQTEEAGFELATSLGPIKCSRLVIATGGLALPQVGASDFGLRLARQFGLKIVEPRPALVPLTFDSQEWAPFAALAGVALPVDVSVRTTNGKRSKQVMFHEDMLFTHRGLSGPAILQISSYWEPGEPLRMDLVPQIDLGEALLHAKAHGRQSVASVLSDHLPKRLAQHEAGELATSRVAEVADARLKAIAQRVQDWQLVPAGTQGYRKAEVMRGGVDTAYLDQRSLEVKHVPGLHFIGEVVDVTGWLGGYNFQWAWASAVACARAIAAVQLGVDVG